MTENLVQAIAEIIGGSPCCSSRSVEKARRILDLVTPAVDAARDETERLRGLLAEACDTIDDYMPGGGPSEVAAHLRTAGGVRP